jgi:hypothetical protein
MTKSSGLEPGDSVNETGRGDPTPNLRSERGNERGDDEPATEMGALVLATADTGLDATGRVQLTISLTECNH